MAVTTAAVIGVAVSGYSASRANSASNQASRNQRNASDQQTAVAREQLAFGREQYNDWRVNEILTSSLPVSNRVSRLGTIATGSPLTG